MANDPEFNFPDLDEIFQFQELDSSDNELEEFNNALNINQSQNTSSTNPNCRSSFLATNGPNLSFNEPFQSKGIQSPIIGSFFSDRNTPNNRHQNKNDEINTFVWGEELDKYSNSQLINNKFFKRRRAEKCKRSLSDDAIKLKNNYYVIFTYKKRFPKELVYKIHKEVLVPQLHYPKLKRAEMRELDIYFQNYAPKMKEILDFLKQKKNVLLKDILKDIKKPRRS